MGLAGLSTRREAKMVDAKIASLKMRNWPLYGTYPGFSLAVVALVLLVVSPLGWHAGWWHFRFAFFWLMPYSAYIAMAAIVVCVIALAVGRSGLGGRGITMAVFGVLVNMALV